ncbi:hypothetical protein, partial [Vibrio mediterranei]
MSNYRPKGFTPLKKLVVCSNIINGGGNLLSISDSFPLLIGKGSKPQIWLSAVSDASTNELIPVVIKNKALHSAIKVIE